MAVLSSGTYTYIVLPNVISGGCSTCSSTLQPHPIYNSMTNSADTVVQLNAVTIGGFNGLNS
jgi:hypothetical protein